MSDLPTERNELVSGLYVERVDDGQIVIFTILKMVRTVVDAWIDACNEEMRICLEQGRNLSILQDLSDRHVTQTPYSRERGQDIVDAYPDLTGRIAFVLPDTPDNQRIRLFVQRQEHQYRERKVFFSRDEGLAWLREALPS